MYKRQLLLVLIDPFFAGQSVLVSPDIVLVFAFLLSLKAILKNQTWLLALGIVLLGLISLRGMMIGFSLFIWWNLMEVKKSFSIPTLLKSAWHKIIPFLPGGVLALLFFIYQYLHLGWIGYHDNSPWAESFASVDLKDFTKNIGILGWRLLDFGRCFLWLGLGWLAIKMLSLIHI